MMNFLKVFWRSFCETPTGYFAPLVAFFNAAKVNATVHHSQRNDRPPTQVA